VPHESVAVAAKLTTALQTPASLLTLMLEGQVITGGMLSMFVMVREAVLVLPHPSEKVHVSV
jgi:hypothetical protein